MNVQRFQEKGIQSGFKRSVAFSFWDGFVHLLFPSSCLVCQGELLRAEQICCSVCFSELMFTRFENEQEPTPLDQLFWGRVDVAATYALLYYEKTNNVKPLLQALKYNNRPDVGIFFGKLLGNKLLEQANFSSVEVLIPVPIHRKKRYDRGYNQSEQLVKGMCMIWKLQTDKKLVSKRMHTQSQTKFGRFKRWDNVENQFYVDKGIGRYKHIALVDDVITTGATLEAIMKEIRLISPEIQISVISLALAK